MCLTVFVISFILFLTQMSTTLIIVFSILGTALILLEGYVCGRVCADLVQRKDDEVDSTMWFWFGFIFSWIALLFTLLVKDRNK